VIKKWVAVLNAKKEVISLKIASTAAIEAILEVDQNPEVDLVHDRNLVHDQIIEPSQTTLKRRRNIINQDRVQNRQGKIETNIDYI